MTQSPLTDAAIQMHEIYLTLVEAGFSENQAMYIIMELLKNVVDGA